MCPLRLILIFLSATLAGFFLLKNLKSQPEIREDSSEDSVNSASESPVKADSVDRSSKVWGAIGTGFWTCVDMASGRYLWRNLVSSSSSSKRCD
ncbi:Serine/arginine-rich splicing factor like [Actinidia chinensis var. chinensis]|uniref:Serine/arginine-rich splicing factor like n=1 Tax=Actinidia chinensis var. chinensis TaxID=1590841 RepID=A0A2R6QSS6_ACTCC|nr:Serine/arginine-rich splicing factor like [Actinidia chinensis var. chinensis]